MFIALILVSVRRLLTMPDPGLIAREDITMTVYNLERKVTLRIREIAHIIRSSAASLSLALQRRISHVDSHIPDGTTLMLVTPS